MTDFAIPHQAPIAGIDPRGPRFAAAVTSVVLALTLITGSPWVLAVQVIVFAVGAFAGVHASPYGIVYRRFVRPRLAPPTQTEDPRPPRFAQLIGLLVTGVALAFALLGGDWAVTIGSALALIAALLNAVFGLCLGCELYLLGTRLRARR